MQSSIIRTALLAAALLLFASRSVAADTKPGAVGATVGGSKTAERSAKPAKATAKVKLVDINRAGKEELKTLPGISDAEADKIIAGRPYLSKAHLTTRDVISRSVYEGLKTKVIARQK